MQSPLDDLENLILKFVSDSGQRLPSWRIEKYLSSLSNLTDGSGLSGLSHVTGLPGPSDARRLQRKEIRRAIRRLVSKRELGYTYEHGCSFLEPSFQRPVRISRRVVLKPPGVNGFQQPGDIEIELMHGASFGTGRHPTTRLSIRGIEFALDNFHCPASDHGPMSLDIGTGSGVLAIVSLVLGIHKAIATDLEACARKEAEENVRLNGLSNKIEITDTGFEKITGRFALITANLRFPTLMKMIPRMAGQVEPGGRGVLSGIYDHEMENMCQSVLDHGLTRLWQASEKGWGVIVFEKG
jgi:ribosomal protein L11 methyltransferase